MFDVSCFFSLPKTLLGHLSSASEVEKARADEHEAALKTAQEETRDDGAESGKRRSRKEKTEGKGW